MASKVSREGRADHDAADADEGDSVLPNDVEASEAEDERLYR